MQHYKKRNPPWIKLYAEILEDEDFECMSDTSKLIYFCLLPFASRKDNKIKNDLRWLNKKLPLEAEIKPEHLQELIDNGFIEDASTVLAVCTHLATPETEKRQSREETKTTTFPDNLNNPNFLKTWDEWVQFRKEIKKKLTPSTISKQLKLLSKKPKVAIATIERSIQNGWQGLFPENTPSPVAEPDLPADKHAEWHAQCGLWLRNASKEELQSHGSFRQRLKELSFRTWAEELNDNVKEI